MAQIRLVSSDDESRNLKDEVSEFKRRRILDEARYLFFRNGYEGTTIDAIAGRLDVTKPYIYSYYKNKSELLAEMSSVPIRSSLAAMDRVMKEDATPAQKLRHLTEQVLRVVINLQEEIVVYVREEKNLEPDVARAIREQRNLFDHRLAELLVEGEAQQVFKIDNPLMAATTIGGMMTWVAFWYLPEGKWSEVEVINHVIGMVESVTGSQE